MRIATKLNERDFGSKAEYRSSDLKGASIGVSLWVPVLVRSAENKM